jgi:hypothetical protein
MCEADKASYKAELGATLTSIQNMAQPIAFSQEFKEFTLAKDLDQYKADLQGYDYGASTEEQRNTNSVNLDGFTRDVQALEKLA